MTVLVCFYLNCGKLRSKNQIASSYRTNILSEFKPQLELPVDNYRSCSR